MSGAEAGLVLGLISSTIAICKAAKRVYDASGTSGLPKAFQKAAESLPLVVESLRAAEAVRNSAIEEQKASKDEAEAQSIEDSWQATKPVIERCKVNATELKLIFEKVILGEGDSMYKRVFQAARSVKPGRLHKVEVLRKELLEDLSSLQNFHVFRNMVAPSGLAVAMQEVKELGPAITDGQGLQGTLNDRRAIDAAWGVSEQVPKTQSGSSDHVDDINGCFVGHEDHHNQDEEGQSGEFPFSNNSAHTKETIALSQLKLSDPEEDLALLSQQKDIELRAPANGF